MADDRELKNVLAQIEKDIGKGAIMRLGEDFHSDVSGISTGALSLDIALGGKGLPRGLAGFAHDLADRFVARVNGWRSSATGSQQANKVQPAE